MYIIIIFHSLFFFYFFFFIFFALTPPAHATYYVGFCFVLFSHARHQDEPSAVCVYLVVVVIITHARETLGPKKVSTWITFNSSRNFTCLNFFCFPLPDSFFLRLKIVWLVELNWFIFIGQGKELVESDRVEMRQADGMASLSLHGITADDSGKYIVMAENTFGMDCHYASLAVEGK